MGSGRLADIARGLVDLVLPTPCPGCSAPADATLLCPVCAGELQGEVAWCRPRPAPPGLPPCLATAPYRGAVRQLVLAYKEHGERRLAVVLAQALARAVAAGLGATAPAAGLGASAPAAPPALAALSWPVVLVPVPGTGAGRRARLIDHMAVVARQAAAELTRAGWSVTVRAPLRARPRADSAHLDRSARARAATSAFALRAGQSGLRAATGDAIVVVVDDVLTTGATIAAVSRELTRAGAPVAFAATVAATELRGSVAGAHPKEIHRWR